MPTGCRWSSGRAIWEREESFADPATIASAAQRAGLDAAALRAGGPSDAELDGLYEQYTQEALAAGVFGAPSYVLPSGEIFWGQDRLDLLERALKNVVAARQLDVHIVKMRPGLRMWCGSSARFSVRMVSISSAVRLSFRYGRLRMPMPCSAEIEPPKSPVIL